MTGTHFHVSNDGDWGQATHLKPNWLAGVTPSPIPSPVTRQRIQPPMIPGHEERLPHVRLHFNICGFADLLRSIFSEDLIIPLSSYSCAGFLKCCVIPRNVHTRVKHLGITYYTRNGVDGITHGSGRCMSPRDTAYCCLNNLLLPYEAVSLKPKRALHGAWRAVELVQGTTENQLHQPLRPKLPNPFLRL